MKILFIACLCIISTSFINAQTAPGKYWIKFTDKNNTPYSISNPEEFLSAASIQRRINFDIDIENNDLPVDPLYVDSLISLGMEVINVSKWFNAVTVRLYDTLLLDTISNISFVSNYNKVSELIVNHQSQVSITSQVALQKNSLDNVENNFYNYGTSNDQITMLNGEFLHNQGFQGQGMTIAVIDAGFNNAPELPAFDSLFANNQILGLRNFVNPTSTDYGTHSHGMNVLSIIGGNIPGELIGSAPKAKYWLLISEDGSSEYIIEEDNWVAAAEFADSVGVDVINTSLGYKTFNDNSQNHTYADMDGNTTRITIGADIAASKGMLIVTSAGNEGSNDSWKYITAPGDADSTLTIGAVNSSGIYASFSSVGPSSDGRVKPNVVAMGKGTIFQGLGGSITMGNGTSFSAPVITGLAACLWQANPQLSNMDIISYIEQSSNQYNNPDSLLGYGIPNFASALLKIKGVDNLNLDSDNIIRVYPNPFIDNIIVDFYSADSQKVVIEIFDLVGKRFYSDEEHINYTSLNEIKVSGLGDLPKGAYIIRFQSENNNSFRKIIKQ